MRRGPKPAKSKEAKPPVARQSPKGDGARVSDLENRLAEALAQQAATSDILKVISRSTFDLTPVLQTLAGNATRLCSADAGIIRKLDGEVLRAVAECGIPRELYEFDQRHPLPPGRGTIAGRAALERRTVHIPDVLADPEYQNTEARQLGGYRTLMAVPMLREGALIGVFVLHRFRVEPFTDRQIGVLQTFADQAVIAIENVRLFTQLQEKNGALTEAHAQVSESLEQQTATSEILRVISSSPTDIQPVLDAVAESAARLCQAFDGSIFRLNEEALLLVAHHGSIPAGPVGQFTLPLVRGTVGGRTVLERQMIHVRDLQQESEQFPEGSSLARRFGHRTILGVPLLREGVSIGCIQIRRAEVEPFTEKQVALLQTFADQAVIAIENVRLFKELEGRNNELTEALEQQTATSEILGVISGSPTDLQPVFGAILANATRLFDSENARIYTFDGEAFHLAAAQKTSPEFQAYVKEHPIRPGRESALRRVGLEKRVVHIPDTLVDPEWAPPSAYQMEGMRTAIAVPLLKGDALIGAITTQRREVRPFTEKQIQLITTFADQAVIAIENVRLFTELQTSNHELTTALDTQTATSDILRVISRSQTDVRPVFDAILASAIHLLNGYTGALTRREGDQITLAALTSTDDASDAAVKAAFPQRLHSRGAHPQTIRDRVPFNVADAHNDARLGVPEGAYASVRGYRSLVVVPLLRHDEAIGTVSVTRREPGGFTNDEIALLQTFADQAVIATENVRLFTELQQKNEALTEAHAQVTESLEQQTATSEILKG